MKKYTLLLSMASLLAGFHAGAEDNKAFRAYNSPVNHNYYQAYFGWGDIDSDLLDEDNLTELGGSFQRMLNKNWMMNIAYDGRFIHGDTSDVRNDRASVGAKYRVSVNDKSDFLLGALIGTMKSKATDRDTDRTLYSETDFMYGFSAEYRYGFNKNWEAGVGVEYTDADHLDEVMYKADVVYYRNEFLGFGAYISEASTDDSDSTELGVDVRFRFK